jgi:WS/DGAT/MGAT family acyltransferase
VFKVHHCMVDGIAGVGLLTALLDLEPVTTAGEPVPWEPRPEPPAAAKVLDAWGGLAADIVGLTKGIPASVVHPVSSARRTLATVEGAVRFAERLVPTRPLSIEGPIGPHRVWAHSSAGLDAVRTIRAAFGGTINDVVLAAVTGGYRALLLGRGDDVDHAEVRSLVPVSTRHEDARGVPDNRVSALLYDLPVSLADPVERLDAVRTQMTDLKSSHIAEAGEMVASASDLAPPMVMEFLTRATIRSARRFGQRSLNTVTTNVPGPRFPLYCLGREMTEYRPFVPISHGLRIGTAIISYNGRVFFGVTGDFRTSPDVGVLAAEAAAGIDELYELALEVLGDHRPG